MEKTENPSLHWPLPLHSALFSPAMAAEVGRARDGLEGRLPSTALPSPAKSGRSTSTSDVRPPPPSRSISFRYNHKNRRRNRSTTARSGRRGGSPESRGPVVARSPVKKLVMEEVTILKRGEVKDLLAARMRRQQPCPEEEAAAVGGGDLSLCSTERLGPDPEILPKQMLLVEGEPSPFAGTGFVASPPPSSLPLPTSFFGKKDGGNKMDLATKGLRYLLRVDLP